MKKFIVLFGFIVLTNSMLSGQSYISAEKKIYEKSDHQVAIHFYNMTINQSDNPTLRFYRGLDTIDLPALYNANFYGIFQMITDSLSYGFYGIIYHDNANGYYNKPNEVFYTNSEYSLSYTPLHLIPDSAQWIDFNLFNSINMSNLDSVVLVNQNEKIKSDSIFVFGNDFFKFRIPISNISAGMYHLHIYRSDSISRFYPNYVYVKNFDETFLYPENDTLLNYTMFYQMYLFGNNTHFLASKTTVCSNHAFSIVQIMDTTIVNDTTIMLNLSIPVVKTIFFDHSIFSIYNAVDGFLSCPIVIALDGSINEKLLGFTDLKIYPNPAHDFLIIESFDFEQYNEYELEISTIDGKTISKMQLHGNKQLIINNLNLKKGLYLLQIKSANRADAKVFVVD